MNSKIFSKLEDDVAPHRRKFEYYENCVAGREYCKETRQLGAVRRSCAALREGRFLPVAEAAGAIAFERQGEHGVLCAVNRNEQVVALTLPEGWEGARRLLGTGTVDDHTLTLPSFSCAILQQ